MVHLLVCFFDCFRSSFRHQLRTSESICSRRSCFGCEYMQMHTIRLFCIYNVNCCHCHIWALFVRQMSSTGYELKVSYWNVCRISGVSLFFYLSIVGVSFLISPEISPKISSRCFPEFALFRISAGVPPGISSRKFSCVALRYPFKIIPNFLQQCLRSFPGNFIFFRHGLVKFFQWALRSSKKALFRQRTGMQCPVAQPKTFPHSCGGNRTRLP